MTDTRPGPDEAELELAATLRKMGVGPDAELPPLPAAPPRLPAGFAKAEPDDWFTRLYGPDGESPIEEPTSADPDPDEPHEVDEEEPEPRKRRRPRPDEPHRALAQVAPGFGPRLRWLVLHATAAAAGWPLGLVGWGQNTAAWFAQGRWTDSSAWVVYGLAVLGLALYTRTRGRVLLVAWLGAVPLSSVVLGVLLYGRA